MANSWLGGCQYVASQNAWTVAVMSLGHKVQVFWFSEASSTDWIFMQKTGFL